MVCHDNVGQKSMPDSNFPDTLLDVGYRPAGIYTDRDEAAYWDGKNLHGEEIANGVYFYAICAGSFVATATRKLVFLPE